MLGRINIDIYFYIHVYYFTVSWYVYYHWSSFHFCTPIFRFYWCKM